MPVDIKAIAQKRRAQFARLTPKVKEHRQRASEIYNNGKTVIASIQQRAKVQSHVGIIPGFYPIPERLAREMVRSANLFDGCSVLEPSAGAGGIADQIREAGHEPLCIEIAGSLVPILREKGYTVVHMDFLHYEEQTFDRIILNPPFERGQDIDHVQHAYKLLNPGGRIVAIMSAGTFYRSDNKTSVFRSWFSHRGVSNTDLPAGTFQSSGTMVTSCLVVIDKPLTP